jgi:hypothetical protein
MPCLTGSQALSLCMRYPTSTLSTIWLILDKIFSLICIAPLLLSPQVWLGAFEAALQAAQRQAAAAAGGGTQDAAGAAVAANAPRQLLERALKSLPQRKHVKALSR